MSAVLQQAGSTAALARAHAVVDELQALDLTGWSEEELLGYWRELERLRRRLPTLDHALVQEAAGRGLPETYQVRSMGQFLRLLLRLDPGEAAGRVRAAEAGARRRSLAGQSLPAKYEAVAAAQQAGTIGERHARIVVDTIEALPAPIRDTEGDELAGQLVEFAEQFDPAQLARLARRMSDCLDPDGILHDAAHRERLRDLTLRPRPDGSASLTGELTAEATELLLTHFDAFAAPKPAQDGTKDPRTAGQRRHDALVAALKANLRARQLPAVAGVTATIIVTMTAEQYASGAGLARTNHGAHVPAQDVFTWAGGDYRLLATVLDRVKGISGYSSTHRLFTENQRLALTAVDAGCTFPNCPMPPPWCEVDHTIDYAAGGPTDLAHGVLACDHHNRVSKAQGWRSTRINGRAAWIPPSWIDPQQRPRYNDLHRTEPP